MTNPFQLTDHLNRRVFLRSSAAGIGTAALASLLQPKPASAEMGLTHHAPKAKRIIYLFQSGAPSQMDLFDPKPAMTGKRGEDLPDSIRKGQRLTTMTSGQAKFPIAPSIFGMLLASDGITSRPTISGRSAFRSLPGGR